MFSLPGSLNVSLIPILSIFLLQDLASIFILSSLTLVDWNSSLVVFLPAYNLNFFKRSVKTSLVLTGSNWGVWDSILSDKREKEQEFGNGMTVVHILSGGSKGESEWCGRCREDVSSFFWCGIGNKFEKRRMCSMLW